MDYSYWIMGAGALACLLGYDYSKNRVLWNVAGPGLGLILCSPALNRLITGLNASNETANVGMAILVLIFGIFLVSTMSEAFKNSSPESTSWGQFAFFGFFKWDDFAEIWLYGAVAVIGATLFIGYDLLNAWNRGETEAAYRATQRVVAVPSSSVQSSAVKAARHSKAASAVASATKHAKQQSTHTRSRTKQF